MSFPDKIPVAFVALLALGILFIPGNGKLFAQTISRTADSAAFGSMGMPANPEYEKANPASQKWFLSHYATLSAGYVYSGGMGGFYLSAPVGFQLNRRINQNLYAFGGLYAAPGLIQMNSPYMAALPVKAYPMYAYPSNYFSVNPGVYMGLMYVSPSGTFTISGSIRAQSRYYPGYPVSTERNLRK